MGEYAEDDLCRAEVYDDDDGSGCICKTPNDNDQGICSGCGRWIGYSDNS